METPDDRTTTDQRHASHDDELAVLLSEANNAEDAAFTVEKIINSLVAQHVVAGHKRHVASSIGIANYPGDGNDESMCSSSINHSCATSRELKKTAPSSAWDTSSSIASLPRGVEEENQLAFLKEHHCEEGQGYIFSHPLTADQFASLLRSGLPH